MVGGQDCRASSKNQFHCLSHSWKTQKTKLTRAKRQSPHLCTFCLNFRIIKCSKWLNSLGISTIWCGWSLGPRRKKHLNRSNKMYKMDKIKQTTRRNLQMMPIKRSNMPKNKQIIPPTVRKNNNRRNKPLSRLRNQMTHRDKRISTIKMWMIKSRILSKPMIFDNGL